MPKAAGDFSFPLKVEKMTAEQMEAQITEDRGESGRQVKKT